MIEIWFPAFSGLLTVLFVINFIIALTIIFLERKDPSATLAWIMILFLIPAVGILFYFMFSQNISRQRIFRLSRYEELVVNNPLREQIAQVQSDSFKYVNPEEKKWQSLIQMNQTYAGSFLTQDNRVSIITDGVHMLDSLLSDIKEAKNAINVEYYIIKNDEAGRSLISALTLKAREGLEVRLLIDAMGGRQFNEKNHLAEFKSAGGLFAFFFPPKFKIFSMKLNYRNHRKLVVIDGKIGYLGGFNIGNEYLGRVKKFGYWRDTHLRIVGSAVHDMNARFILDWRVASKESLLIDRAYYGDAVGLGRTAVQIVTSGPDSSREEVKHSYLKMISAARKNIYIQTPYFVPDVSILESLKTAALSGVDVRIMIPRMPDHMFVYWATYYYAGVLIDAGARVYIYDNGFLHAKTMAVDGEVASIGSANFDNRSFRLNFEGNAFIYDAAETYKIETIFETDAVQSHELTKALYRKRSIVIKFKEGVSRLLSGLL
ncbi:MAG: cardiolipin synthase [Clostridiales Family XIII bacterium]|jgi:cardiolipin synthase|nr:cardiolipin synthase [Clostridiales Family XIII bacterium]